MEPMKRMIVFVSFILMMAIIGLIGIYILIKNFEKKVVIKSVFEREEEKQPQEALPISRPLPKPFPQEAGHRGDEEAGHGTLSETEGTVPSSSVSVSEGQKECDAINEEDFSKYLKIKDEIFPIYNNKRQLADLMLDQERLWYPDQIKGHMLILMEMKVRKKQALEKNGLAEKKFRYITNALMEWVLRTKEIEYEKKYIGEEDFYLNKIGLIVPCEDNDRLFKNHKAEILKTFMGDFELVDY